MAEQLSLKDRFLQNPLGDLSGGLMAAIVGLPLCLAFGVASGLGAAAGLYGAIACGIIAALFGGTRGQCSGPTGPMTVVAASVYTSSPHHPELVFASVLAAGIIQMAMGFGKTGKLIGYMPYPVISGFMSGIGAIIICIQIGPLFGIAATGNPIGAIESLAKIPDQFNQNALVIGLLTLTLIYLLPIVSKRLPATLIAVVLATWLSTIFNMELPRIGSIPSTIPTPSLPGIRLDDLSIVLQSGLTLAMLGAIDSLLTSLVLDKVTGKRHDSNQELIGQGLGNMMASLIGGLPGAGATMRSMVNVNAGGTTALSGAFHGFLLLAVLLFFGQIAGSIPLSSLAAILITVGLSIMDWRVISSLHKTPRSDAAVMLIVLGLTIFVDLIVAVLVGVALASMLFAKQLADTPTLAIDELDTLEELRELTEHIPESARKNTYSFVINGPLFFGEARNLADTIDRLSGAKYVILRFVNVPLIDQTGAFALENAIQKWESRGITILFVNMQPHIRKTLEDTGVKIDLTHCFERFEKAIEAIQLLETRTPEGSPMGSKEHDD